MLRDVVVIDRTKCNGCGSCVTGCHEGALQIIDGKAVLVSELMCDGLGACIGECPEGAISVEKKEAQPYSELRVMEEMFPKGENTVRAHMMHLKDHQEYALLNEAIHFLRNRSSEAGFDVEKLIAELRRQPEKSAPKPITLSAMSKTHSHGASCPGSKSRSFTAFSSIPEETGIDEQDTPSALTHWPVQLHLINPLAGHFRNSDLLLAADCVAFSMGNFHARWLQGKTLAIACPKLDSDQEIYVRKLTDLIETAKVNTITVLIMEVPCCGGLVQLVRMAAEKASRKVPVKTVVVSIQGEILRENWN